MILADRIRRYVIDTYIVSARQIGHTTLTLGVNDIHTELELENRMPAVCDALDAQKFYGQAVISLVRRTDSKQGASAE